MENQIEQFEQMMLDYLKGKLSPEDTTMFIEMLRTNEDCKQKYRELSHLYVTVNSSWFTQRKDQNLEDLRLKLNFRNTRKHIIHRSLKVWSTAAIWLALAFFGFKLWFNQSDANKLIETTSFCHVYTPTGATTRVLLPDSTVVILNGGSNLKYESSWTGNSMREVFLSGEAYFQVKKSVAKPFVVHADKLNIKVLGTTFNVSSYPNEETVKVSLIEGSVNVYTDLEKQNSRYLSPNQQAVYQKGKGTLAIEEVDAGYQVAWTTGKLIFVNEKLYDILKKIEKKFGIEIVSQSRKVHEEYFSGTIRLFCNLVEKDSFL